MSFKQISKPPQVPSSPEKLLLDLPRRRIPGVLAHQAEVMRAYAAHAVDLPDVALQLPTGSGKTLVGALIAEWIRRKRGARVVYLAPTVQLVNQVVEQCENKYGIQAIAFHGPANKFTANQKSEYRTADKIAVAPYSHLFNSNPFFDDADTILLDDAHASENYVAKSWSLSIEKQDAEQTHLFELVIGVLKRHTDANTQYKLSSDRESNNGWIEKLSTPAFMDALAELREIIDAHSPTIKALRYPWALIRDHLQACHLYFNESEIHIRPLIPPTWTHSAFTAPRQRIYMSATLGAGGDLERQFGRREITRIPVPTDWDKQGVGRRLFLFPGMSLEENQLEVLRLKMMQQAGRSLVLVPSKAISSRIESSVKEKLHFPVFNAADIEESATPFTSQPKAVAIVANRYDGIDFPGDSCRLLFIDGLPRATNLQERFLMNRMGANLLFNERVQTRILQAIGRCTRSLEDFSAVVVLGDDLQDYLTDPRRRTFLHPEIQAEIGFGMEQSKDVQSKTFEQLLKLFLENGEDWEKANQDIIEMRESLTREEFPAMRELAASVSHEIAFQAAMWQGDYINAMEAAGRVLGAISGSELRGYRALWNYLAGTSALLAFQSGMLQSSARAKEYFFAAKNAAVGLPWLVALARREIPSEAHSASEPDPTLMEQVEAIERNLERLGTSHDRKYASQEKEILDSLASADGFERGHEMLGQMLGFNSSKIERDGSPDPWWSIGDFCLVFEDHAGSDRASALSVEKARQAADHPRWIRENVPALHDVRITPVIVTPVTKTSEGATPHLRECGYWKLDDFREWAKLALTTIREIRSTYEASNLAWRMEAAEKLRQAGLDMRSLQERFKRDRASDFILPQ